MVIAVPDHWHAPAAILASKAGKHVYLEKPCSHNPNEGELLVAANKKYKNVIQMGNQRRSFPNIIAAIEELHAGAIGRALLRANHTRTMLFIITGIGSGIGVQENL